MRRYGYQSSHQVQLRALGHQGGAVPGPLGELLEMNVAHEELSKILYRLRQSRSSRLSIKGVQLHGLYGGNPLCAYLGDPGVLERRLRSLPRRRLLRSRLDHLLAAQNPSHALQ